MNAVLQYLTMNELDKLEMRLREEVALPIRIVALSEIAAERIRREQYASRRIAILEDILEE
jgi:hypothetical protein